MKLLTFLLYAFLLLHFSLYVHSQNIYIPDDHFEQALIDLGYDSGELNDSVAFENIESIKILNISNRGIISLQGIEHFNQLEELNCSGNSLTHLNLMESVNLKFLDCSQNRLAVLDLSKNLMLEQLDCSYNSLVDLDLSNQVLLNDLKCHNNQLARLNIKNGNNINLNLNADFNSNLLCIQVDDVHGSYAKSMMEWRRPLFAGFAENCFEFEGKMTTIPDNNFENYLINKGYDTGEPDGYVYTISIRGVKQMNLYQMGIVDLTGIEDFEFLTDLDCSYNQIVTVDLSKNLHLTSLKCNNNNLSSLNLRNGNNVNMSVDCKDNYNLFCVEADDLAVADGSGWRKSPWTEYSNDCFDYKVAWTYIPDDHFERRLIELGLDFGNLNDSVPTSAIKNLSTLILKSDVQDLTGIEDFVSLKVFSISSKKIIEMDLSPLKNLADLEVSWCEQLTHIKVSENTEIERMFVNYNRQLETLDVTSLRKLTKLECMSNIITELDLSQNPLLHYIRVRQNPLTCLNIKNGNNRNITYFDAQHCPGLICIQADSDEIPEWWNDNINLYTAFSTDCSRYKPKMTYVPDANFKKNLILYEFDSKSTPPDSVITSGISKVKTLMFMLYETPVYDMTGIEDFTALESLSCGFSEIEYLDLSANTQLNYLYAPYNKLKYLNLKNRKSPYGGSLIINSNPELFCVEVDNVGDFNMKWQNMNKDPWTRISENCSDYCEYFYSKKAFSLSEKSCRDSIRVSTYYTCGWEAIVNCNWLTLIKGTGVGSGYMVFEVDENLSPEGRKGEIIIGADTIKISQSGFKCTYQLSFQYAWYDPIPFKNSFTVKTSPQCEWTASSDCDWVIIKSKASGMGNDTIFYDVLENTTPVTRHCTIRVENEFIRISQSPYNCTPVLNEDYKTFSSGGGEGTFYFHIQMGCEWKVRVNSNWLVLTSLDYGTGPGGAVYTVKPNNSPDSRKGEIWINDKVYMIHQDGLPQDGKFTYSKTNFNYTANYYRDTIQVLTLNTNSWHAWETYDWLNILKGTGVGSGSIIFEVDQNLSFERRTGEIRIGEDIIKISQDGWKNFYTSTNFDYSNEPHKDSIFMVTYSTYEWEARANYEWLRILKGSGVGSGYIIFEVDENLSKERRTGEIMIGADIIKISQAGFSCVSLSAKAIWFLTPVPAEGSFTIQASPECEWTVSCECDWVTITSKKSGTGNGQVLFNISENPLPNTRYCSIRVENQIVNIEQDPYNSPLPQDGKFTYSKTNIHYPPYSYRDTIQVFTLNTNSWHAWETYSWLNIQKGSGVGSGSIVFTVDENLSFERRTGEIRIGKDTIKISQDGWNNFYTRTNIEYSNEPHKDSIWMVTYHTNKWEARENSEWLRILKGSGVGSGYIVFEVDENLSKERRMGEIMIGADTIKISQRGFSCISLSAKAIWFLTPVPMEGSFTIQASSECEWTVSCECDWVTITSKKSGTGSGQVLFNISENLLPNTRYCSIRVENQIVTIEQDPYNYTPQLHEEYKSYGHQEATDFLRYDIQWGIKWNITVDCDWVILTTPASGTHIQSVGYTVKANPYSEPRDCKIWVNDKACVIHQKCRPPTAGVATYEYEKLLDVYGYLNGMGWTENNWLDTTNTLVGDWRGVTIKGNRVEALDLSGFNLEGEVTNLFFEFDSLKRLDLSNNNLYGSFAGNTTKSSAVDAVVNKRHQLEYLNISNNRFTFADLESSAGLFSTIPEFVYSPQANLTGMDTAVYKNKSIVLSPKNYNPGNFDVYTWEKNGTLIQGKNEAGYEIINAMPSDSGFYHQVIRNSLFPDLQLAASYHLSVLTPVGIKERLKSGYKVYPNPASDKIYIETQNKKVDICLYSLTGSKIMEINDVNSEWISIAHLKEGIYNLVIQPGDTEAVNFRVIVSKK